MRTLKIPLYNYLSLLACTPLYNFKKGILIHEKYFKIFSIFMSSVLVMNFILYFYNFLLTVVVYSGETMHVPVLLTFILFHLFDVVVILNQAVLKRKDWMLLLKYMQQTEFVGGNKRFRTAKLFYVPYFIMFIFGTHSVIVWWRFKYKYTLGAFILQSIPDMLVTTTVFLMGNIALLIRYRLLYVNEQLEQITTIVYVVKTLKENLLWKVRQFYKVIELIKLFNNIFGWCILIYSGIILIGFLSTCTLLFDRYYDDYPRTDAMIVVVNRLVNIFFIIIFLYFYLFPKNLNKFFFFKSSSINDFS